MKKIVAFLMAFALCIVCFGTYGFADVDCHEDHCHTHDHVVKASDVIDDDIIDDGAGGGDNAFIEYLYVNKKQTSCVYNDSKKTLTFNLVIDSESTEKGKGGGISVTTPYTTYFGKPTEISGTVFGYDANDIKSVVAPNKPGTNTTTTIFFDVPSSSTDPFTQYARVTIVYPVNTEGFFSSWMRKVQISVAGTVTTVTNKTVPFDTNSSICLAYLCNHAVTEERVTVEATCKAAGEKEIVCVGCGYVKETKTIMPTNHNFDYTKPLNQSIVPYRPATCTSFGSGQFMCKDCGYVTAASIPKLDHKFGERVLLNGIYYFICSVCGTREVAENQCSHDPDNYAMISIVRESTCAKAGVARYQCPQCRQVEERELPLVAHNFASSSIKTHATCTTAGVKVGICSVCMTPVEEAIPALGHDYGEWATTVVATCVKPGTEVRACTRCNVKETRTVTGSGHEYGSWVTTVPASCVANGTEVRVCELCNQTQSQVIPMTGHTYGVWETTTAATCVASGVETRTCVVCGATDNRTVSPIASNHKFGDWKTVVAKTCVTDGEKSRTCELCQLVETETDPCTGHVLGNAVVDGKLSTKSCGVCDYKEVVKTVKNGTEKTLSSAAGSLVLVGAEAEKNYTFEIGVPNMETEAYYKQYLDFYKAYTFKVLVDGTDAAVNSSMELTIATDPFLENYEISVLRLVGNSFYPVNEFERDDDKVIIPGAELSGAEVIFVVKGEEASPNLVVPIVVTVATVLVAGAAVCIFMVKGKKKSEF